MKKKISIIINNAIRITKNGHTLADGGNVLPNDLAKMGVDVRVIGLSQKLEDNNINTFISKNVMLSMLTLNINHNSIAIKTLNYTYAMFKLMSICISSNNFYVYVPSNISLLSLLFIRLFRKKYGLYVRGNIQQSRLAGKVRDSKLVRDFYHNAVKNASFVLVTGKSLEQSMSKLNKNTELVVPMINFSSNDLYNRVYSNKTIYELLYVGRIDKEKGVEELIEASAILYHKTNISFNVTMIGGGSETYINFLKQKLKDLDISKFVELRGRVNESKVLKDSYKNSDILVFPSHHEGFPRVLYEAMTFSLPIITTNLETYNGIMDDKKNCLMVDINNPIQLANRIEELLKSSEKQSKIGLAGYEFMKSFYAKIGSKTHAIQIFEHFEKMKD